MGLETGKLLVAEGASVTLVGRQKEKLDAARKTFDTPDNVKTYCCDLTNKGDLDKLILYISEEMQDVKCLINAAGVFSPKAFLEYTESDYDAYMDLNRAIFFVTQRVAKNMVANGGMAKPARSGCTTARCDPCASAMAAAASIAPSWICAMTASASPGVAAVAYAPYSPSRVSVS